MASEAAISLAAELRRLRGRTGLTGMEMAKRLGIDQSRVSRIERANTRPRPNEIYDWCKIAKVPEQECDRLIKLRERAQYTGERSMLSEAVEKLECIRERCNLNRHGPQRLAADILEILDKGYK